MIKLMKRSKADDTSLIIKMQQIYKKITSHSGRSPLQGHESESPLSKDTREASHSRIGREGTRAAGREQLSATSNKCASITFSLALCMDTA